jgi:hypothetical protein
MPGKKLLSTAYLPPIEYFSHIADADEILIEREENYVKQSYRNRCYILSSNGPHLLTVPVYLGSFHKTPVKDIRIDYSKRWQQVHIGALKAAYTASPFFLFYFEEIEKIIHSRYDFLLDLNMNLLQTIMKMMNIDRKVLYTNEFLPVNNLTADLRYDITPQKKSSYIPKNYIRVFDHPEEYIKGLSVIDLLFNTGPDAVKYL